MPERVVANIFGSPYEFPLEKIASIDELNPGDHLIIFNSGIFRDDMILDKIEEVSRVYHEVYAIFCILGTVKRKIIHFEGDDTIYRVTYQPKGNPGEPRDASAANRARSKLGKVIGVSWSARQFAFCCKHENMGWDPQVIQVVGCLAGDAMAIGGVRAMSQGAKVAGGMAAGAGVLVEVGCAAHDIHRTRELRRKELIDDKEKADTIVTRVVVGASRVAGAASGSFLGGAMVGAAGGPVGAIVGGVIGIVVGTGLGVATSKVAIMAKEEMKQKQKRN